MKRAVLALALAACGDSASTADEQTAARAPRAAEVSPNVRLPVTLPSVDAKYTRPMIDAPTFVALKSNGVTSAGKLSPGLRASGAAEIAIDKIDDTLEMLLDSSPAERAPRSSAHGRLAVADDRADTLVLADASARSKDLIAVLEQTSGRTSAVAVRGDRPARLPFTFTPTISRAAPIHLDVTENGVTLYGAAIAWGDVETELKKLIESQRSTTSMNLAAALTVTPQIDVQRLVTVLVALANAGFDEVELTVDATAPQLAIETTSRYVGGVPTVSIGQPNAQGDLDKAIIRRYIKRNIQKIQYCYEKQLLAMPGLAGTVIVQFMILADGKTRSTKASGVHPAVSACVASVIGGIEFPKPKDGGSVQVAYPFTFRPGGG
jgi:biopolymer transport protein ExbD